MIWRNNDEFATGLVINERVEIQITDWNKNDWRPSTYNLTLQVFNQNFKKDAMDTFWFQIWFRLADAYANSIILEESRWVSNEEYALGPPDGKFCQVSYDYGNGYITLDMGQDEEIVDKPGPDFSVIAQGGNYSVLLGNSLVEPFINIGMANGNTSFDLSNLEFKETRFIRIEFHSGQNVEIDCIIALYYNHPVSDTTPPIVHGPPNQSIWENNTKLALNWEVYDKSPWNYSISVNNLQIVTGIWDGSDITFMFSVSPWKSYDEVTIVLIVNDAFGNHAKDSVAIYINHLTDSLTDSKTILESVSIPSGSGPSLLLLFFFLGIVRCTVSKRKKDFIRQY